MVALNKHFVCQMLTDLLESWYLNTYEYYKREGCPSSFNVDLVQKLCDLEVENYTFFLLSTKKSEIIGNIYSV